MEEKGRKGEKRKREKSECPCKAHHSRDDRHEWPLSRSFDGINKTSLFHTARRSGIQPISIIRRFLVQCGPRRTPALARLQPDNERRRRGRERERSDECARRFAPIDRSVTPAPLRYSARLNSTEGFLPFNRALQGTPCKYRNISRRNARGLKPASPKRKRVNFSFGSIGTL